MENEQYEQEKKGIQSKFLKTFRKSVIGGAIGLALLIGGSIGSRMHNSQLYDLKENSPIYREYKTNQDVLNYLRSESNKYTDINEIPEDGRTGLENLLKNIFGCKIEAAKQDSSEIVNSPEFIQYKGEKNEIHNKFEKSSGVSLGGIGSMFAGLGVGALAIRRRDKELELLKQKYGVEEGGAE